jgi:UDP-glucose 4-epimerase
MAHELEPRLGVPCALELAEQTEFTEPRVRVNTDPLDAEALGWDEAGAWDKLAVYYREAFG